MNSIEADSSYFSDSGSIYVWSTDNNSRKVFVWLNWKMSFGQLVIHTVTKFVNDADPRTYVFWLIWFCHIFCRYEYLLF
jgi:hypothetical protein